MNVYYVTIAKIQCVKDVQDNNSNWSYGNGAEKWKNSEISVKKYYTLSKKSNDEMKRISWNYNTFKNHWEQLSKYHKEWDLTIKEEMVFTKCEQMIENVF